MGDDSASNALNVDFVFSRSNYSSIVEYQNQLQMQRQRFCDALDIRRCDYDMELTSTELREMLKNVLILEARYRELKIVKDNGYGKFSYIFNERRFTLPFNCKFC